MKGVSLVNVAAVLSFELTFSIVGWDRPSERDTSVRNRLVTLLYGVRVVMQRNLFYICIQD